MFLFVLVDGEECAKSNRFEPCVGRWKGLLTAGAIRKLSGEWSMSWNYGQGGRVPGVGECRLAQLERERVDSVMLCLALACSFRNTAVVLTKNSFIPASTLGYIKIIP